MLNVSIVQTFRKEVDVTRNQIEYWNLQEQKRANAAKEVQLAKELEETKRANTARELESARSNRASEQLKSADIARAYDSNAATRYTADARYAGSLLGYKGTLANVGLGYSNLAETTRSHKRNESITALDSFQRNAVASRNANTQSRLVSSQVKLHDTQRFANIANVVGMGATQLIKLLGGTK